MVFCAGQIFRGLLAFAAAAGSGTSFCPDPDQFPIFADADSWLRVEVEIFEIGFELNRSHLLLY